MHLVTGGTGFIGRVLVQHLLDQGERVRVVGRRRADLVPAKEAGAEVMLGDLRDPILAFRAVEGVEKIFHLAGVRRSVEPARFWRDNVEATLSLSRAFARRERGGRLVLLSSLAAAGPSLPGRPRVEQDPEAPVGLYGRSKLAGEQAVRTLPEPLSWVVLRPSLVYGAGGVETLDLFRGAARGRVRVPRPDQMLSLVSLEDLVAALILCANRAEAHRRVYFLAGTPDMRFSEIAHLAGRTLGRSVEVGRMGPWSMRLLTWWSWLSLLLGGRPSSFTPDRICELKQAAWQCSAARIRSELGWEPVSSHGEAFQRVVAWGRRAGRLPQA